MEYIIKQDGRKGEARALADKDVIGKMTFSTTPNGILIIDHTEVDKDFRNLNIGKSLLMKVVDKSRTENLKVIPLCPFANAMFKKDKTIQDVLKDKI